MGVGAVQLLGEIESAFAAQIDVDQRDIRAQFFHPPDCLSDCRGDPDNRDSTALKQSRGYFNKHGVVINNYAPQLLCSRRHHSSFAYGRGGAIPASCKPWTILGALGLPVRAALDR